MANKSKVRTISDKKMNFNDVSKLYVKYENKNHKFSDLFLVFQPSENSRGTDHFIRKEKIQKEQIFRGTDH